MDILLVESLIMQEVPEAYYQSIGSLKSLLIRAIITMDTIYVGFTLERVLGTLQTLRLDNFIKSSARTYELSTQIISI